MHVGLLEDALNEWRWDSDGGSNRVCWSVWGMPTHRLMKKSANGRPTLTLGKCYAQWSEKCYSWKLSHSGNVMLYYGRTICHGKHMERSVSTTSWCREKGSEAEYLPEFMSTPWSWTCDEWLSWVAISSIFVMLHDLCSTCSDYAMVGKSNVSIWRLPESGL